MFIYLLFYVQKHSWFFCNFSPYPAILHVFMRTPAVFFQYFLPCTFPPNMSLCCSVDLSCWCLRKLYEMNSKASFWTQDPAALKKKQFQHKVHFSNLNKTKKIKHGLTKQMELRGQTRTSGPCVENLFCQYCLCVCLCLYDAWYFSQFTSILKSLMRTATMTIFTSKIMDFFFF